MKSINKYFGFVLTITTVFLLTLSSCSESSSTNNCDELEWNKKIVKNIVHSFALLIGSQINNFDTEEARIEFIRTTIDSVRFYEDNSGYFYVYDLDCVNIAHAIQKELQGQNLYDHQDTRGKFVIRELSQVAQNGGGFVEFYWIKPGTTGEKKKMGYVEPIPNTNYFIGSGVYEE